MRQLSTRPSADWAQDAPRGGGFALASTSWGRYQTSRRLPIVDPERSWGLVIETELRLGGEMPKFEWTDLLFVLAALVGVTGAFLASVSSGLITVGIVGIVASVVLYRYQAARRAKRRRAPMRRMPPGY